MKEPINSLGLSFVLACPIIGSAASPTTLTFDDGNPKMPAQLGILVDPIPPGYAGFQWNNFDFIDAVDSASPNGFQNGVVSPRITAFNSVGAPAKLSYGTLFNLNSAYLTAGWNDNLRVEVQGMIGMTVIYDNTYTVSTAAPTLLNFGYVGIDSVNFIASGGTDHGFPGGSGTHFAMDNFNFTPVPEPSVGYFLLLFAAGLLGAGGLKSKLT